MGEKNDNGRGEDKSGVEENKKESEIDSNKSEGTIRD
jgi:hypothetical protein